MLILRAFSCILSCLLILFSLTVSNSSVAEEKSEPVTIAMTAAFVTNNGTDIYGKISDYIGERTKLDTEFLTGLSYSTVNAMVEDGATDVAFVCGYPYILSHDKGESPKMKLLAAPVMESELYEDKPVYYSYVIVHKDSAVETFEDLKAKRWVYNDKTSNSGYNMPRAKMVEIGETDGFFSEVLHSGSHEESIRMVASGEADVSAVDSLVLDYALLTNEPYADQVRIIEKLGPAGIPPVVRSVNLSEERAAKVKEALLHMHEDPEGQAILKEAFVKKFVEVDDSLFDGVRKMHKMAVDANYMDIK